MFVFIRYFQVLDSKFEANRTQKSVQLSRSGEKTVYRLVS